MSKFSKLFFSIAIGAVLCWWYQQQQPSDRDHAFLAFLAVGQGDAIYIRASNGADILIDGGPDRTVLEELPAVMRPGDDTIELMMLSHPDADHINGLVEVVKRYQVKQIVTTALPASKATHEELLNLIALYNIEHIVIQAGDQITLGPNDYFDILYPASTEPLQTIESNDTSFIAEYHYLNGTEDTTVLLTGDAGEYVEEALLARQVLHDIDILKVGHHGSQTSSNQAFLEMVRPEVCVIQVGKDNPYGHPKPEILERLQPFCEIRRTDQSGTIIIDLI